MLTVIASVAALTLASAVPVKPDHSFSMECTALSPSSQAKLNYGPHEGSEKVTISGTIDTKSGGFNLSRISGTGIARTGWLPINKFDDSGPYASANWQGADGLYRFFGIHFVPKGGAFVMIGFTLRNGRKVMEYYSGYCTIS